MQEREVAGINALVSNTFLLGFSFWVVSYGYKLVLYGKKTHGFIEDFHGIVNKIRFRSLTIKPYDNISYFY